MTKFQEQVLKELEEMKALGMEVPDKAFALAREDEEMKDYENMKVSECADLLIALALVK